MKTGWRYAIVRQGTKKVVWKRNKKGWVKV